ncbi:MAG: hypothetical protein HWN70_06635 [Desulfobacterales bacterium]|nr:hypothetical protein [Desulfobacterales bacterium]
METKTLLPVSEIEPGQHFDLPVVEVFLENTDNILKNKGERDRAKDECSSGSASSKE